MIEPDHWIEDNASFLGIQESNINPASVDVCLGEHIIIKYPDGNTKEVYLTEGDSYTFMPGNLYICHTEEFTRCPVTHAWMIMLKSSSGRKGLDHAHSGWGDPGFAGQITFEFTASIPVSFNRGQRIAQLVYMKLTSPPYKDYSQTGRYQNQTGATEARTGS